jgi:molybdenum cofactor cytidylyltransferase
MKRNALPGPRMLVLAAGFSRRLGRPKALVRVRGISLLRRTALLLGSLTPAAVIVVVPPRAVRYRVEVRGLRATLVANPGRAAGLAASVRIGLRHASFSRALLLLPVDLPRLQAREVQRLLQRWRGAPRRLVARGVAGRAVTPLILPRRLLRLAAAVTGDGGLKEFVARLPDDDVLLCRIPSAEADVDTAADLARARRPHGG